MIYVLSLGKGCAEIVRNKLPWRSPSRRAARVNRWLGLKRGVEASEKAAPDDEERSFKPTPTHVVHVGYDAHACVKENLAKVIQTLEHLGQPFAVLPAPDVFAPKVVIDRRGVSQLLTELESLDPSLGWTFRTLRQLEQEDQEEFRSALFDTQDPITEIRFWRNWVSTQGESLSTVREQVRIQLWADLSAGIERIDGSTFAAGTLHSLKKHQSREVRYLSPTQWDLAQQQADHLVNPGGPLLMQITEPIDLVYTWVDGSDLEWQKRKKQAEEGLDRSGVNPTAIDSSRFANRDELKYSLRSVEMFANWVRHIYIVTDGQVPDWLDCANPKITIVDHKDIFRNPNVLPVFNSRAIESQLHHIDGISERYLYLNDDVFFARPVSPSLFVSSNGVAKFFVSTLPIDLDDVSAADTPIVSASKNGRKLIHDVFGQVPTRRLMHVPHVQTKSILEEMEETYPEIFEQLASSQFRHPRDFSIAAATQHYYAYIKKMAKPGRINYAYVNVSKLNIEEKYARAAEKNLDVICLNDTYTDAASIEVTESRMSEFLEIKFPIPSSFEVL